MKKVLLTVLGIVVLGALVGFMVWKAQSGNTTVLTGKVVRQDLATVVSGTGQIKPKTYVNVGATSFGRITHLEVKEGDHVTKGQVLARVENVQPEANVAAQQAMINFFQDRRGVLRRRGGRPAKPISSTPRPILSRSSWIGIAPRASIKAGIMAGQDFDAKKAAYDLAVATAGTVRRCSGPVPGADRVLQSKGRQQPGDPSLQRRRARQDRLHRAL